jgi:hypothetical protein
MMANLQSQYSMPLVTSKPSPISLLALLEPKYSPSSTTMLRC